MTDPSRTKRIQEVLVKLPKHGFPEASTEFFQTILGHDFSESFYDQSNSVADFFQDHSEVNYRNKNAKNKDEEFVKERINKIQISLIINKNNLRILAEQNGVNWAYEDKSFWSNFPFLTLEAKEGEYPRKTEYARITRIINRRMNYPVVILLSCPGSNKISLSLVKRRPSKQDKNRDVIESKVSMLYAIDCTNPHRADLELLKDLSVVDLIKNPDLLEDNKYFDNLVSKWLRITSIEKLNKKFYTELSAWFSWAVKDKQVKFPLEHFYNIIENGKDITKHRDITKEEQFIRLVVRLIFVWFIKEKGFIPAELFKDDKLFAKPNGDQDQDSILVSVGDPDNDDYYRAILQNLFFATLNTEITGKEDYQTRGFSKKVNADHRNFNKWRYKDEIRDPDNFKKLMNKIPFMNGGLFDCLDSFEGINNKDKKGYRLDCFTDNPNQRKDLYITNRLFFGEKGIITIFNNYKFTLEENTALDIDVALDPELLGLTFENLLASYNQETREVARRETGSYYTPKHIVHFMVVESLKEYFRSKLLGTSKQEVDDLMHYMFDPQEYKEDQPSTKIKKKCVEAINELKILDPAVGSGAFPMEILNTCVNLLDKLDPQNTIWEQLQLENIPEYKLLHQDKQTTDKIHDAQARKKAKKILEKKQKQIEDDFKKNNSAYLRKLYLIRNSIFGVDIQPIACQLARLRFFISLAIEQDMGGDSADNYGINSLPNLETNFIAADALIYPYEKTQGDDRFDIFNLTPACEEKYTEVKNIRDSVFNVRSRPEKLELLKSERQTRKELRELIRKELYSSDNDMSNDRHSKHRDILIQEADKILSWDFADQNLAAEWFDPSMVFTNAEDFDIVIANPPYIQLQKDGGKLGKKYDKQNYSSFTRSGDIYTLFYERGIKLLRDKGILTFITSNKWMRTKYGAKLREFFVTETSPRFIIDLGGGVFESVTVDTNILLTIKSKDHSNGRTLLGATIGKDQKKKLESLGDVLEKGVNKFPLPEKGEQWIITSELESKILAKVRANGITLGTHGVKIHRGILTGKDEAFLLTTSAKEKIISRDKKSAELIKPVLQGRDIKRWQIEDKGEWLIAIFPPLGIDIDSYPAIKSHLLSYGQEKLEPSGVSPGRSKGNHKWFEIRPTSYVMDFEKEKIVYSEIVHKGPQFYLDAEGYYYGEASSFIMTGSSIRYLIAFLNSDITHAIFGKFYAGGGLGDRGKRYKMVYLKELPIPKLNDKEEVKKFTDLGEQILALNKSGGDQSHIEKEINKIQAKIDILVAQAYGLTQEEVDYLLNSN